MFLKNNSRFLIFKFQVIKLKNHRMAATSLSLNHTLCRTFSSSLDAINGPEMTLPPVKRRKRCTDQGQAGKETHAGVGKIHALKI